MKKHYLLSTLLSVTLLFAGCNGGQILNTLVTPDENGNNIATDVLTGLLGNLTENTSSSSIVGTWVYNEPAIQMESNNLLGQLGGAALNSTIEKKIKTYYEKLGIKKGSFSFTFNKDLSCSYILKGSQFTGTYEFNESTKTIKITTNGILSFPSAFAKVSGNQLELTFDTTSLLNLGTSLASSSGNTTLGAIGELANNYTGMKTGFNFTRSK